MPVERSSRVSEYGIAIIALAGATAIRLAVDPMLGDLVPFAFYFLAVTAVAFFTSLGPALFTMTASTALGKWLFVPPRMTLSVSSGTLLRMAFFFTACGLILVLAERINRARRRMQTAAEVADAEARAVQRERTRLQEMVASLPGVVWEASGEPDSGRQRIDYVSDYAREMLGYPLEEWTSTPNFWLQIVAPEDREAAAKVAAETFASGCEGTNEFRWIAKDGRAIWVLARSTVIRDERDKPAGMRGVTFDITDRKEIERRLALLAELSTAGLLAPSFNEVAALVARRMADVIGDGCVVRIIENNTLKSVAYAHRCPEANRYIQAMAQATTLITEAPTYPDLLKHPRTIVVDDIRPSEFDKVKDSMDPETFERFRTRHAILSPLISNGRVSGFLALGRSSGPRYTADELRLVEAVSASATLLLDNARLVDAARNEALEARAARAEAEEAVRIKDEFLATLSHELRTPLNAILGWAHMLQDPLLPPERRQAAVETIVRNAKSQEQLIADILDVQRIMAGKIRLNAGHVDLGPIVRAAAETVQPSADAKQIRLQLLVDLDVPAIFGDPDRLKQIVWNLLSNAIKFAPQGGRVQVRLLKHDAECELVVEDNGPGVAAEFLPFVFERFRQADSSTTRTHKGLGLGLAIVKSLVEMHGGTITATNVGEPGRTGAVFTIRLPRRGGAGDEDMRSPQQMPVWLEETPSLDDIRVLVVEDDGDARELIGQILQRCGAQVTVAASAAEGFEAFRRQAPDVVISDLEMPQEDGFAFIRRIRALGCDAGRDVPAAALTAYASPSDRMKALGAGFNIHLAKPVQPAELAIVVARLAGRTREKVRSP